MNKILCALTFIIGPGNKNTGVHIHSSIHPGIYCKTFSYTKE